MSCNENTMLSFCIPVYNQRELVKSCVEAILAYKGPDIEIIISDDCSTEDIESLVQDFNDSRVRYFRNEKNLGFDLNILRCFELASSDFAFLLRTKDHIIADAIPLVIEIIKSDPTVGYITGNAIFPDGSPRLTFQKNRYSAGKQAFQAHMKFFLHPSGSAYSVKLLDLARMKGFIKDNITLKNTCISPLLARTELAEKGAFAIVTAANLWIYPLTVDAKTAAVNVTKSGHSPTSPRHQIDLYSCKFKWGACYVGTEYVEDFVLWLFEQCLFTTTWLNKSFLKSGNFLNHYNITKIDAEEKNVRKIRRQVLKTMNSVLSEYGCNFSGLFWVRVRAIVVRNAVFGPIHYLYLRFGNFTRETLRGTPLLKFLQGLYSKLVRRYKGI